MRISDWSSDVCSSDLIPAGLRGEAHAGRTPDEPLVGGLRMLEREIGDAARNLASGAIDKLAVRERYLQLTYEGLESADGRGNPRSPDQARRQRCAPHQSTRTNHNGGRRPHPPAPTET